MKLKQMIRNIFILYYIGVLSESWFLNSFNVIKELSTGDALFTKMIKLKTT